MDRLTITIQHGTSIFAPSVKEGVEIEWSRVSSPGKLTFTMINDTPTFSEGDCVRCYLGDKQIFQGYIFTRKFDREGTVQVTAYDQLRYFQNKFSYVFEKKTASQIIKALCADYELNIGEIANTKYIIPAIAEENSSAFDIALTVLQETLMNTGDMYVLYDDCGKIRVSDVLDMAVTTLINENTAENYDYQSSIDNDAYNEIVLYYKDKDSGSVKVYEERGDRNISKWGLLRYFEEVKNPSVGANKAKSLLKLYNKIKREFKVTGAFGDINVRGGSMLPIIMKVGDKKISNYMLVDKVVHKFDENHHTMDLTLEGEWD